MCGNVLSSGACDPTQENLFPAPDADGNDPLAMVQQALPQTELRCISKSATQLPESTCTDNSRRSYASSPASRE